MKKAIHLALFSALFFLFPTQRATAQDPDIQNDRWDEIFRTSDLEGETPTASRRFHGFTKRVSVPDGSVRLGCLCMDDTPSDVRSKGACSGHGGVRYWIYKTAEGDSFRLSTQRNEVHPEPLDTAEMSAMSYKKAEKTAATRLADAISMMPITIVLPPTAAGVAPISGLSPMNGFSWERAYFSILAVVGLAALRLLLEFLAPFRNELAESLREKLRRRR